MGMTSIALPNDVPLSSLGARPKVTGKKHPFGAEFTIHVEMALQKGLNKDRTLVSGFAKAGYRNDDDRVEPYSRIDFKTEITNQISDHRLRVVVPTPLNAESVDASSIYDIVQRGIGIERVENAMQKWAQKSPPTSHTSGFVDPLRHRAMGVHYLTRGYPNTRPGGKQVAYRSSKRSSGQCGMKAARCPAGVPAGAPHPDPRFPAPPANVLGIRLYFTRTVGKRPDSDARR